MQDNRAVRFIDDEEKVFEYLKKDLSCFRYIKEPTEEMVDYFMSELPKERYPKYSLMGVKTLPIKYLEEATKLGAYVDNFKDVDINELDYETIKFLVSEGTFNITFVKNRTEELIKIVISSGGLYFLTTDEIKNYANKDVAKKLIDKSYDCIKFFSGDEELCDYSLTKSWAAYKYIDNKTEKQAILYAKQLGHFNNNGLIKEIPKKHRLSVIKYIPRAIKYVKQNAENTEWAVKQNPQAIAYIKKKFITYDLMMCAVNKAIEDGIYVNFHDIPKKLRTEEFTQLAIKVDKNNFVYLENQKEEDCWKLLEDEDGEFNLKLINNPEICEKYIKSNLHKHRLIDRLNSRMCKHFGLPF